MARKRIVIDPELIKRLAEIECTYEEMEHITGYSQNGLRRRYAGLIRRARAEGKRSLRRKRFDIAMEGSVPMLIWLSKQMLGESDKTEQTVKSESRNDAAVKELADKIELMLKTKTERLADAAQGHTVPTEPEARVIVPEPTLTWGLIQ